MELSSHYPPFAQPTLLLITNHCKVRSFFAHHRSVEEKSSFELTETDAQRDDALALLYTRMWDVVRTSLQETSATSVWVCLPEINRSTLQASIPDDLRTSVTHVIPKNLVMMESAALFRILLEV